MTTRQTKKLDLEVKLDQNSDNAKLEYNLLTKWRSIFKVYTLCPTKNQQILGSSSWRSQFLDMCSTYNVVQSALYIVPAYHDGKLFVRYMEQGIYKGFTSKFISALTSVYNIPSSKVFPWMVYTDKDFLEASIRRNTVEKIKQPEDLIS